MAQPNPELILAIRQAADNIESGDPYQWGHMGCCNCGHLAQVVTCLDKVEIHRRAMQRVGDWNEQLNDYCPSSGLPMDELISELLDAGLSIEDLQSLEKLSDTTVLKHVSEGRGPIRHNVKDDVVQYMRTWAEVLEEKLLEKINLSSLNKKSVILS